MMMLLAAETGHHAPPGGLLVAGIVSLLLLIGNAFFVGIEIALLAASRARLEELAVEKPRKAARALRALSEMTTTFTSAQLGITITSLGLGAVAEPALAYVFEEWLDGRIDASIAGPASFIVALSIVVFIHMVVGEMLPKNLSLAHPERISMLLASTFRVFTTVARPIIGTVNALSNALVRLFGVEPVDERSLVQTPEQLRHAVTEATADGYISSADALVLNAALALETMDARDAMTPRTDLITVDQRSFGSDVLRAAAETGFTRFPVTGEDLDEVVGLIHVKDVLIAEDPSAVAVTEKLRPIVAVPEGRDLGSLLRDFRVERQHAVLVVDEFGSTSGLVTLEDVLEELVGDINDEFDTPVGSEALDDRRWVVEGTLRKDELYNLTGLQLPDGVNETVSGYIVEAMGRLPLTGDVAELDGWKLTVRTVTGRRAGQVEVLAPAPRDDEDDASDDEAILGLS